MNRYRIHFINGGYTEDTGSLAEIGGKYGHIAKSVELIGGATQSQASVSHDIKSHQWFQHGESQQERFGQR